jgi:chemotaxis protein histidine kinase CheA
MSEGPGFLEFFILEASEYVEQLDGLLLRGGSSGPDVDAMQRVARALRGTATMAKIPAFAQLASAIERVGRAIHDGSLQWEPLLSGALVAAVDDLKTLLHAARKWSPAEDRRASARTAELSRFAPLRAPAGAPAGIPSSATSSSFLSTEASNIAAGLELLTTRASDVDTAANVLRRIRALRGVAGVKEVEPLAEALAATEDAGRTLEAGQDLSPK